MADQHTLVRGLPSLMPYVGVIIRLITAYKWPTLLHNLLLQLYCLFYGVLKNIFSISLVLMKLFIADMISAYILLFVEKYLFCVRIKLLSQYFTTANKNFI